MKEILLKHNRRQFIRISSAWSIVKGHLLKCEIWSSSLSYVLGYCFADVQGESEAWAFQLLMSFAVCRRCRGRVISSSKFSDRGLPIRFNLGHIFPAAARHHGTGRTSNSKHLHEFKIYLSRAIPLFLHRH
jgi:hypothetical protein